MSAQEVTLVPPGSKIEEDAPRVVRVLMSHHNLKSRQMAELLHLHPNRFSERMTGKRPFSVAELADIAHHVGAPITVFFEPAALAAWVQNWKKMNPGPRGVPMRDEQLQFTFGNVARPLAVVRSPH